MAKGIWRKGRVSSASIQAIPKRPLLSLAKAVFLGNAVPSLPLEIISKIKDTVVGRERISRNFQLYDITRNEKAGKERKKRQSGISHPSCSLDQSFSAGGRCCSSWKAI